LLKKKDKQKAEALIGKIFRSYTEYSTDIREYRDTRKALLEALQGVGSQIRRGVRT
jgi:hypothetical protein